MPDAPVYQIVLVEIDRESQTCTTSSWYVQRRVSREVRRLLGKPYDTGLMPFSAALAAADASAVNGAVFMLGDDASGAT